MTVQTDSLDHVFADAAEQNAQPLWTVMHSMVQPQPAPHAVPHLWKYAAMKPLLDRAGDLVGTEDAERRVFMLINPALRPPFTTDTIYAGLQLIRPSEVARAHRHTAFALRFIIEGHAAFTAVGGEKVVMERGDLVLTPSWEFHDHGNESDEPMIWLDGLDLPLFHHIPVNFAQPYSEHQYPSTPAVGASRLRYPWPEMQAQLDAVDGPFAQRDYIHRDTGGPISATIGARALRIDAGANSPVMHETTSAIYHVIEGHGETRVGDKTIAWERGDVFCIPNWARHEITAHEQRAYLFRYDDGPLMRALGWYQSTPA